MELPSTFMGSPLVVDPAMPAQKPGDIQFVRFTTRSVRIDEVSAALRSKLRILRDCKAGWLSDIERLKKRLAEARLKCEEYDREIADVVADCARLGISTEG